MHARGLDVAGLEGRLADQHGIQDDAHAPHIDLVAVASLPQNLRSNVVRSPAQSALALTLKGHLASQSKVSNLEDVARGEEEVAELQVAVDHVLRFHVLDGVQQLVHEAAHILKRK